MPAKSRKQGKANPSAAPASVSSKRGLPEPFTTPDSSFEPFLEYLDPQHVFIIHVDKTSRLLKRNTFFQVLLLNLAIAGVLLWRAIYIAPYYQALVLTFLTRDTPLAIDTENTPIPELINAVFNRSGRLFLDFAIFRVLGPWPWAFFVGQTSPSFWRTSIGFQEKEVTIRRSRLWDQGLPKDWLRQQNQGEGRKVFEERISPAINKDYIRRKTGYLMMDKSWDLDFPAMVMAQHLVAEKKMTLEQFEKTVVVHTEEHGWLVWPVWRLDEGADDVQRQKLVLFKDKLTAMGKENLFFRWIELIQFESSQSGGFTPERQEAAMQKAKQLFESQGIDFEKFWQEVGGVEGLPGWDS